MPALAIAPYPTRPTASTCTIPGALQQFIHQMESWATDHRNMDLRASEGLRNLRCDLEKRWQTACFEGYTSSGTLLQLLEDGWKEWKRIAG